MSYDEYSNLHTSRNVKFNPRQLSTLERRASIRMSFDGAGPESNAGTATLFKRLQMQSLISDEIIGDLHLANENSEEQKIACFKLMQAVQCREKYEQLMLLDCNCEPFRLQKAQHPFSSKKVGPKRDPTNKPTKVRDEPMTDVVLASNAGIIEWSRGSEARPYPMVSLDEFVDDYCMVQEIADFGPCKSFCRERLKVLDYKYRIHVLLNGRKEKIASHNDPADWSTVVKVDTHVHLSSAMTGTQLLQFIKGKAERHSDEIVMLDENKNPMTLQDLFSKNSLDLDRLTFSSMDCFADNTFQRFDKFNSKYNIFNCPDLRNVFLKTENHMKGKYFAEITKHLLDSNDKIKTIKTEYRVSIYGRDPSEWSTLSDWIIENQLLSESNQWMIQIPRLYSLFRKSNAIQSFKDMMDNIFMPLFEVTVDPQKNTRLFILLQHVSGFDSVDDESKLEPKLQKTVRTPKADDWTSDSPPPYAYYMYYLWANIYSLNKLREVRGLNALTFRPHCGESGDLDHLAVAFLVAQGINHGINLDKNTTLQYLYYITQIGVAVSPLSNSSLFLDYDKSPFPKLFRRGLNVSLSTDDPMQFHLTDTPLLEEYSIASKQWALNDIDISEIAKNSVLQSGFDHEKKSQWLGKNYFKPLGTEVALTNIPLLRECFRLETQDSEFQLIERYNIAYSNNRFIQDYPLLITVWSPGSVPSVTQDDIQGALIIDQTLNVRQHYDKTAIENQLLSSFVGDFSELAYVCANGVFTLYSGNSCVPMMVIPNYYQFVVDMFHMENVAANEIANFYGASRLTTLGLLYKCYKLMNSKYARKINKKSVDFMRVHKVDTHVHLSTSSTSLELLQFMKNTLSDWNTNHMLCHYEPETGQYQTIKEIFGEVNVQHFTIDSLDMKIENDLNNFPMSSSNNNRFSRLRNPFGSRVLREVFLRKNNLNNGIFLADLTRNVFRKNEKVKYIHTEVRTSIHGGKQDWDILASWIKNRKVKSKGNVWYVQIPQVDFQAKAEQGQVRTYQDWLQNLFEPLFDATFDEEPNPLAEVLQDVAGFDLVPDSNLQPTSAYHLAELPAPGDWTASNAPPYGYCLYYLWANLTTLNAARKLRGLNAFTLKPHCGLHAHFTDQIMAAFLLADGISHGVALSSISSLQYLYYLAQISISMSPLAEDAQGSCRYRDSPFRKFFEQGLNLSLSTDNPMQLHMTENPLLEEYSIASKMFKLGMFEMCELARNSVLQSGFSHQAKQEWLGPSYHKPGVEGNGKRYNQYKLNDHPDIAKTGIPNIRVQFRADNLSHELNLLRKIKKYFGQQGSMQGDTQPWYEQPQAKRGSITSIDTFSKERRLQ